MIFLCDLWRFSCPHLTCCWQTKWCLLASSHGLWFELLIQNSCQHLDSSSHSPRPTFLGQLSSHQRNLLDCSTKASATRIHLESSWVGKKWKKLPLTSSYMLRGDILILSDSDSDLFLSLGVALIVAASGILNIGKEQRLRLFSQVPQPKVRRGPCLVWGCCCIVTWSDQGWREGHGGGGAVQSDCSEWYKGGHKKTVFLRPGWP